VNSPYQKFSLTAYIVTQCPLGGGCEQPAGKLRMGRVLQLRREKNGGSQANKKCCSYPTTAWAVDTDGHTSVMER
ncbi:hypothetical protein U0070_000821, partial [Myodes glareolus]